jgi:hypothetical protein
MLYLSREMLRKKIAGGETSGLSFRRAPKVIERAKMPDESEIAKVKERFGEQLVGRIVPFRISTPERCDDGLAVAPKGCNLEEYDRVPMVLWAHMSWSRPRIGDSVVLVRDDAVDALAVFWPRDISDALDGGFSWAIGEIAAFRGHRCSIGFDIVAGELPPEDVRKVIPWALDVTEWRLREWSLVNMGMDDDAIAIGHAKAAGVDTEPVARALEQLLDAGVIRELVRKELERMHAAAAAPAPVVSLPAEPAPSLEDSIRSAFAELGGQLPSL